MEDTHLDPASSAHRPRPDAAPELRSVGGYRVLRLLGAGGMGSVYLAYDDRENRKVAVKVLADNLSDNRGFVERFYREARSGRRLDHPNIVHSLDFGQDRTSNKHFLVLEYIDGGSAHALLDRLGKVPVGDAVHIALDVARALEHAHARHIIHRDIKPDNILLTRSGVAKLSDLGLAKRTDQPSHLTGTRQGFGTTPYMPYEQAVDAKVADARSDIYALGATLYHLVTGSVPFPGDNHLDVVEKKGRGEFAPAGTLNPEVPPTLDGILGKMLARQPRERYQTASELIVDLERSRLAAALPSFADPTQALQDPLVRDGPSTVEPTRPDPETTPRPEPPPPAPADGDDVWLLRYRNPEGRLCRARATTPQIVRRLRAGRLPAGAEARRPPQPTFQPLKFFPEFRSVRPARRRSAPPAPAADAAPPDEPRPSRGPGRPVLLAAGLLAALLTAALLLRAVGWLPF
jgi:serine/threonine-protein kinase